MSEFFEKNKKKGSLALLLLFLKKGKGIGPMLALTVMLAAVFILPSTYSHNIPLLAKFADALGLGNFFGRGGDNAELGSFNEALMNARRGRDAAEGQGPTSLPAPDGSLYNRSLGYVKREETAKEEAPRAKAPEKAVDGVLRPEDAKKMPDGVALKEDELHNGLMNNNAMAGAMGGGGGVFANRMGLNNSLVNNSRSNASFGGGRADDKQLNMMRGALNGGVPGVGGASPKGGAGGKLSAINMARLKTSVTKGSDPASRSGTNSVFFQLAQGRAYSVAAAPSSTTGGLCNPPSCPNEYASNASGTVFDGKAQPTQAILGAPALGEASPVTPDSGSIGTLSGQADQLQADAQKCQQVQKMSQVCTDPNNPAPGDGSQCWENKMQADSNKLNNLNCGGGGCGGNASQCQQVGDQMKQDCQGANAAFQREAAACPLSGGHATTHDCNAYN